ncbi:MAG: hypothetical protein H6871_09440 [Methylobacteriaceae bacterium]|nr:hypothetical protein [Methylobacteriaceae bacterium]
MRHVRASLAIFIAAVALSSPARARRSYIVKVPTIGCVDRTMIERVRTLRDDGGAPAADVLAQSALDTGRCQSIPAGLSVVEEDNDIVAGLTKVRPPGAAVALWVRYATLSEE